MSAHLVQLATLLALSERGRDWLTPERRIVELPTTRVRTRERDVPVATYGGHHLVGRARLVRVERWCSGAAAEVEVVWTSAENAREFSTATLVGNLMVGAQPPDVLASLIPTWEPMPLAAAVSVVERARWAMRRIERRRRLARGGDRA